MAVEGGVARSHSDVPESRQTATALASVLSGVHVTDNTNNPVKPAAAQAR